MNFDTRVYNYEHLFLEARLSLDIGEVLQIAEVSLEKGTEFPTHTQVCDELTFCVSGSALIKVNNTVEKMEEGQVHYVKSGANHTIIVSKEKNFRYICVGFTPNPVHPTVKAFKEVVAASESFVANDNGYIKRLSELLVRELYLDDKYSNKMANAFIIQILTTIIRLLQNNNTVFSISPKSKKNSSYAIYEILRYIDREYLTITSIHALAKKLNYSESYLSHLFVQKIGTSLKEYITKKKIEHSIELLKQCDLTVEDISELLSFSSPRVFRRAFKRHTGNSPSSFRNK